MYSGLLNYCLREATSALRQNKLACRDNRRLPGGRGPMHVMRARDICVTCTASRASPTVGPFLSHDPLCVSPV